MLNKNKNPFHIDAISDLQRGNKTRGRDNTRINSGQIELAFRRGEHKGYLDGYKDGKKGKDPVFTEDLLNP